jgi:hypothetical protein
MAILCDEYDLLFTHVPKTAGVFVEHLLVKRLAGRRVGGRHAPYHRIRLDTVPSVRAFVVREPVSWYRSYWAFSRQKSNTMAAWPTWGRGRDGHPTTTLDLACASQTFEGFVEKVLDEFPNGFVRTMYCNFLNGATHAIRMTNLRPDLEQLLRLVEFDRPSLARDFPAANETAARWKARTTLPEDLERRLAEVDNLDGLRFPYFAG